MKFVARIWKFGDNINTDLILPNVAFYLTPQEQLKYIFRANRPGWVDLVKPGDILIGGKGRDVLYGGSEADVFLFKSLTDTGTTSSTRDVIADFRLDHDRIDLSAIDARSNVGGNDIFRFVDNRAFSGLSGELHYVSRTVAGVSSTIVEGDVNGDRLADFQIELSGRYTLVAADFVL